MERVICLRRDLYHDRFIISTNGIWNYRHAAEMRQLVPLYNTTIEKA